MRQYPITDYVLAVDFGGYDHAALRQPTKVILQLGGLRHIPLGTEYLEVVKQIRQTVTRLHTVAGWGARPVHVHVIVAAAGPG